MRKHPVRRLSALGGALLLGTLGVGATAVALPTPAPVAPAAPSAPNPKAPTAPEAKDERIPVLITLKKQPGTPTIAAEKANLKAQGALIEKWREQYGLELDRQFGFLFNGISATIPVSQIGALSLDAEVESVRRERVYEKLEHTARELHGAPSAFGKYGVDGTGTVISVIDSGVDPSHRDMRLDDCGAAKIQKINPAKDAGFTCKVPNGYNYADENFIVKDTSPAPHGMHVAGITAANGSEGDTAGDFTKTGRLDGIAPNAQVLAMKVFSNTGGGAADSDIIAAIEDSVKMKADVINMSLGSPNGLKNTSDGTSIAIQKAREAGVITVVAAGNDGQNFSRSGGPDDAFGRLDDGTVGAPSTQGSALSVASIDNTKNTELAAFWGTPEQQIAYVPATGTQDGKVHDLVPLGRATEKDIAGKQLDGAFALVQRGDISFADKYKNAIAAGAGGIVVYNNAPGGFGMGGVDEFDIPGIVISKADGDKIAAAAKASGKTTIRVTDDLVLTDNEHGMKPSSFTSWGSTPSLDFEPEIAGIGGGVYSTFNDDTYGPMSGTSMASPNVAGLSALVIEHLNKTRPEVTGAERVDLAKVMLMNTAVVLKDDNGVPFSPRQIGAGLARVDAALASTVTATVEGEGGAALREVSGSGSFTVTLTNFGKEDRTFSVPSGQQVLAETNKAGEQTTVRVSGGSLKASDASVTVPAGGTATVSVTVSPEKGADHFFGGWFELRSDADGQPDLRVPYLGFAGDWNAESILLEPDKLLAGEELPLKTQLITKFGGMQVPLSSDLGEFWLSPNGDGSMDVVGPSLVAMRNAEDVQYEVLDANGKVVKVVGQEQGLRRTTLGDFLGATNPEDLLWTGPSFDGTVWNQKTAEFEAVPDGQYTFRVKTRLAESFDWQNTDMAFGVDSTEPVIELGALEGDVFTFSVTDAGSGVAGVPTVTDAAGKELKVVDRGDGTFAVTIDPAASPFVTIAVLDKGFNLAVASKVFSQSTLVVSGADKFAEGVIGPKSSVVSDGKLIVSGFVSDDVASVRVNGHKPVESANGRFRDAVELSEGKQSILVEALDAEGKVLDKTTVEVTYDGTAPTLEITEMATDASGAAVLDDKGSVVVKGRVADEREGATLGLKLTVGKEKTDVKVAEDGTFTTTVTPGAKDSSFVLTATDGANSTPKTVAIAGRGAAGTFTMPTTTNIECLLPQGACFIPGDTKDLDESGTLFTLKGTADKSVGSITFIPGARVDENGDFSDQTPIEATIAEDGTFSAQLPMPGTGENHFRMIVTDAEGKTRYDRGVRFFFDVTAPTLKVEEPTLIGGTLYTNTEQVPFRGTASDDGWGYGLRVNDSVIIERFDRGSPGEESNTRDFEAELTVADGDTLLVHFQDANGNVLLAGVPVVLDKEAPKVTVDTVENDEVVTDDRELTITGADENLASMSVSMDGEIVSEEQTALKMQEHPFEDALKDLRELKEKESAEANAEGAEEAPKVLATSTMTSTEQTSLKAIVKTADLAVGEHTLSVVATDLAGNVTTETRVFTIDSHLSITGEDALGVEVHREVLADQAKLAEMVLSQLGVALDGDAKAAEEAGATLELAPNTVLVEGEQKVVVLATDKNGRTAEKEVTVTVKLKSVTLTDGDVTATSTFRSDDVLTAKVEKDGKDRVITLSTQYASLPSVITVKAPEGSRVLRVLEGGKTVEVNAAWADGVLTFQGPSHGVYKILAPSAGDDNGGDNGDGTGGGNGGGNGDGSGKGDGKGSGSDDPLARTGVEAWGAMGAAAALLAAGTLMVRRRR